MWAPKYRLPMDKLTVVIITAKSAIKESPPFLGPPSTSRFDNARKESVMNDPNEVKHPQNPEVSPMYKGIVLFVAIYAFLAAWRSMSSVVFKPFSQSRELLFVATICW